MVDGVTKSEAISNGGLRNTENLVFEEVFWSRVGEVYEACDGGGGDGVIFYTFFVEGESVGIGVKIGIEPRDAGVFGESVYVGGVVVGGDEFFFWFRDEGGEELNVVFVFV